MIAQLDARVGGAATRVDLGELVGEELAVRRRSASDAATTIEYSHVPGLVVQADPVRLRRLITNLLDNAERHAASMVSVRVWYEPAINARSSGFAMLEVLDDGPGIAPDQRELVFQRFIRLDAARAKDSAAPGWSWPSPGRSPRKRAAPCGSWAAHEGRASCSPCPRSTARPGLPSNPAHPASRHPAPRRDGIRSPA